MRVKVDIFLFLVLASHALALPCPEVSETGSHVGARDGHYYSSRDASSSSLDGPEGGSLSGVFSSASDTRTISFGRLTFGAFSLQPIGK